MTHILITDLREIRYMAYVPEEPKIPQSWIDDGLYKQERWSAKKKYKSALEKAKRESVEFDRVEDREKLMELIIDQKPKNWDLTEVQPGIYQVPVEKPEIVHKNHHGYLSCCRSESECSCGEKVARLKSSEPKPESQDDLMYDLLTDYRDMECTLGEAITKLSAKFNVTRKRG